MPGDMRAEMEAHKNVSPIVTELFLRGRNFKTSLVFKSKSDFKVPKTIRLNDTHYFIMKLLSKRKLQQITSHLSSDIEFNDFNEVLQRLYWRTVFTFIEWYDFIRR